MLIVYLLIIIVYLLIILLFFAIISDIMLLVNITLQISDLLYRKKLLIVLLEILMTQELNRKRGISLQITTKL